MAKAMARIPDNVPARYDGFDKMLLNGALELANTTAYGLSSAVVTRDLERGATFARRLQAGMTHVNDS
jgi:acyl-CoA reductase-like NAD-dependent aldehyde dehydrogenase